MILGCWNAQIPFCSRDTEGCLLYPVSAASPACHALIIRNVPLQTHNPSHGREATVEDNIQKSFCAAQCLSSKHTVVPDGELNIRWSPWVTSNNCPVKVVISVNTKLNCQWHEDVVFAKKKRSANQQFFFFKAPHLNTEVQIFKRLQESLKHHFWITLWCLSQCSPFLFSWAAFPSFILRRACLISNAAPPLMSPCVSLYAVKCMLRSLWCSLPHSLYSPSLRMSSSLAALCSPPRSLILSVVDWGGDRGETAAPPQRCMADCNKGWENLFVYLPFTSISPCVISLLSYEVISLKIVSGFTGFCEQVR